jgi:hypothetical protein
MRKALTILLFAVLAFQASVPVQIILTLVSSESSEASFLEKPDHSLPSIPCEEPAPEGEAATEESETFHLSSSGVIPYLLLQSEDRLFSDLPLSSVPEPVLDELKPPPQA